jgi:uncharacterized membrane protein YheB (UPF0754 family)
MNIKLIMIPFISGLIGWITNLLAVRMIFHPYHPIGLGPFRIQGLVPKRREELAMSIGQTVSTHLISHEDIANCIKSTRIDESFEKMIDEKLEVFIQEKLFSFNPMLTAFISPSIRTRIKEAILSELILIMPELAEKFAFSLENSLDLQGHVTSRIKSFDLKKLEKIILEISSRELKAIEIYGGILGFIIGLVQVGLILL